MNTSILHRSWKFLREKTLGSLIAGVGTGICLALASFLFTPLSVRQTERSKAFETQRAEDASKAATAYAAIDGEINRYQTALDEIEHLRTAQWIEKLGGYDESEKKITDLEKTLPTKISGIVTLVDQNRIVLGSRLSLLACRRVGFLKMKGDLQKDLHNQPGEYGEKIDRDAIREVEETIAMQRITLAEVRKIALDQ